MKYIIPHDAIILCNKETQGQFDATKVCNTIYGLKSNERRLWELELHVTNNCNLKCRECSYASRRDNDYLTAEVVDKTVNEAIENGVKTIFVSGGGDPTVWREWNKFFINKEKYSKVDWGIATNAINLISSLGEHIDFFSLYQIHLLGYDHESVKKEAGIDVYDRMDKSLKYLLKNKSPNTQVTLKFLLNDNNIGEVTKYLDYIEDLSPDIVIMKLAQDFLHNENRYFREKYKKIVDKVGKHTIMKNFDTIISSMDSKPFDDLGDPVKCWVSEMGLYFLVRGNGDVYPCVAASYANENNVGNIHTESISDILNNKKELKNLHEKMHKGICPLNACRHYRFSKLIEEYKKGNITTQEPDCLLL